MRRARIPLITFLIMTFIAVFPIEGSFGDMSDTSSFNVSVKREITILNGGYIQINDTFFLLPSNEHIQLPSLYLVGLPKNYYRNLIYSSARDPYGSLDVKLYEEDETFKWFKISLRTNKIGKDHPYNFTMMTIFSDLIKRKDESIFRAEFPLYPALKDESELCNVTLVLPPHARVLSDSLPRETFLNMTSDFMLLNNVTSPLPANMNVSSWVEFSDETFSILKILEIKKEISINGRGRIYVVELYDIEVINAQSFILTLPPSLTDITVYDVYNKYPEDQISTERKEHEVILKVFLAERIRGGTRTKIAVTYSLPMWEYIEKRDWQVYALRINVTKPEGWFIPRIKVSISLPEGASVKGLERYPSAKYERIGFQEKITFEYYNITKYDVLCPLYIEYCYTILWAAFRPTIVAIAIVGLAGIIIAFVKPASVITTLTTFPPETLKTLIQRYEEMEDILSKIESLKEEYKRGKISKRQYYLMRKMFEEKLGAVKRNTMELMTEIKSAGGRYAEMIERLEKANSDIENARRRIDEADLRLYRKEISAEEYYKIINEYTRKLEKAKSIVNEIILRLKLET